MPSTLPSDLRRELADQLLVLARIDLALEELRSRSDRDAADLTPQALAGAGSLEPDLLLRRGDQALALLRRGRPRLLHDVVGTVLRLLDDPAAALARFAEDRFGAFARLLQLGLAPVGRGESVRDLALALLDRGHEQRPDLAHREPDDQGEDDHLDDESEIDVHALVLSGSRRSCSRVMARAASDALEERVREHEEQGERDADEGHGIEQRRHDEHSDEQSGRELGLARHSLEESSAENTEADGGAERSHAENQSAREGGHRFDECNIAHSTLRWVIPELVTVKS